MFLSNLLNTNIKTTATAIIAMYIKPAVFKFPAKIFSPAYVEEIIDGILASVDIRINFHGLIGSNPAIYTSKSFGVPGNKNRISIIISTFLGS